MLEVFDAFFLVSVSVVQIDGTAAFSILFEARVQHFYFSWIGGDTRKAVAEVVRYRVRGIDMVAFDYGRAFHSALGELLLLFCCVMHFYDNRHVREL